MSDCGTLVSVRIDEPPLMYQLIPAWVHSMRKVVVCSRSTLEGISRSIPLLDAT